jgi:catechol 2,3-dioxygenase-like lactoylglutathione lyase family enzyme
MKRMHLHVGVEDLDKGIRFYSALFGSQPAKTKSDYAKWMLDEPRLNFAISTREGSVGLSHLGIQVDSDHELEALREQLRSADLSVLEEGETVCCYARSDKSWIEDPAGIAWETYRTMDDVQFFDAQTGVADPADARKEAESGAAVVSPGCC